MGGNVKLSKLEPRLELLRGEKVPECQGLKHSDAIASYVAFIDIGDNEMANDSYKYKWLH